MYEIQTTNIAVSDVQRNFCKKPQLKIFSRSGGVVKWAEQTDKQTDIEILLIYREYRDRDDYSKGKGRTLTIQLG